MWFLLVKKASEFDNIVVKFTIWEKNFWLLLIARETALMFINCS